MFSTISSKLKLAAISSSLGLVAAVPGFAHAGQLNANWNFTTGSSQTLGTSQSFTSSGSAIAVTAYGYATTTGASPYNAFKLYSKYSGVGANETGLGLASPFPYNEIDSISKDIGFIQIDMSSLLAAADPSGLNTDLISVTIGSITNPDGYQLSYSNTAGSVGTKISSGSNSGNGFAYPSGIALSTFSSDKYLTISATAGSILLDSMSLAYTPANPTNPAGGNAAPTPASAGLLIVGGLGMIPLLLLRRRKIMA